MQGNKLVTMVNQIAQFHHRAPEAAAEVAHHLERFWEARMRKQIFAHLEAGGEGMSEVSKQGVALLKASDEGKLPFTPAEPSKLSPPFEA